MQRPMMKSPMSTFMEEPEAQPQPQSSAKAMPSEQPSGDFPPQMTVQVHQDGHFSVPGPTGEQLVFDSLEEAVQHIQGAMQPASDHFGAEQDDAENSLPGRKSRLSVGG